MDRLALVLLRARRKDDVEEELTREARRGRGEHLLRRWSSDRGGTGRVKELMIKRGHYIWSVDNSTSFSQITLC